MQLFLHRAAGLLALCFLLSACTSSAPDRMGDAPSLGSGSRLYHVQLQLTDDKKQAIEILGQGQQWWTAQPDSTRPSLVEGTAASAKAVHIEWKAPYYRVRLGPFATEAQAETVLDAARPRFPDAFVVPDRLASRSPSKDGR